MRGREEIGVHAPDDSEIGGLPDFLRQPFGIVRRRGGWMLLAVTLGLAASAMAVVLLKPRYRAEAIVLVTTQQIPEDMVRSTLADDALQRLNSIVGEVLSRERLARLVEEHGLYPELRERATLAEIVERVRSDISIEAKPGLSGQRQRQTTRLFGVAFEAASPQVAAAVANELAGVFADESIRVRTRQTRLTADFLRTEMARSEQELREQSRLLTDFRQRHGGELPGDLAANLARLDRLQQKRQTLGLQLAEAETRLALLSAELLARPPADSPAARREALRARLERELAYHTPDHPNVKLMQRELALFEEQHPPRARPEAPPALMVAAERMLGELRGQAVETDRQLDALDARIARTPERQEELAGLEQREAVLREQYLDFLRKVKEAELGQSLESAQQGERFSILDPAAPPSSPTKRRWKYLVAGVVGSVIMAFCLGVVLETLDPVLLTSAQLQTAAARPVLGLVGRIS